ncbi:DUF2569 family protein [Paenibacillus yanchengensis]|uniref:DUF2569 family protein n=1 Tax=Paenibacillus yanchengensis TaxID=2035833 RepID=A0ABW4YQD8_9BACL
MAVIFSIFILVQFNRKKMIVPRLMIIFFSLNLFICIFDYIMLQQFAFAEESEVRSFTWDIIRSAIMCLIWIPYFLRCKRVKNTFVK